MNPAAMIALIDYREIDGEERPVNKFMTHGPKRVSSRGLEPIGTFLAFRVPIYISRFHFQFRVN